jgi:hypothetical protein
MIVYPERNAPVAEPKPYRPFTVGPKKKEPPVLAEPVMRRQFVLSSATASVTLRGVPEDVTPFVQLGGEGEFRLWPSRSKYSPVVGYRVVEHAVYARDGAAGGEPDLGAFPVGTVIRWYTWPIEPGWAPKAEPEAAPSQGGAPNLTDWSRDALTRFVLDLQSVATGLRNNLADADANALRLEKSLAARSEQVEYLKAAYDQAVAGRRGAEREVEMARKVREADAAKIKELYGRVAASDTRAERLNQIVTEVEEALNGE